MIYWKSNIRKILERILRIKSSNWLTKWYPNLTIHVEWKAINHRILKRPKMSNFTLYFESNCLRKSTPKFGLKMNNQWSNIKLKGQIMMKFYDFPIHTKLMKQEMQFGKKWRTIPFLKWNWLPKSNLNYNYCKRNDRFTLLTRLTWRLGSKSRRLKCIWSVSSSAYVRHSRGEFDQILQRFVINPALIRSNRSLGRKGILKNSGFRWKTA